MRAARRPRAVESGVPRAAAGLSECLDAAVLVTDWNAIGFRHELARRATLDQMPDNQRKALHARALAALAASADRSECIAGTDLSCRPSWGRGRGDSLRRVRRRAGGGDWAPTDKPLSCMHWCCATP